MKFDYFLSKLSWPVFFLVMMLQRSPMVRYIAEIEFSLFPRIQHLWTIVAGAATVGAYNSVTAASEDLRFRGDFNDTTVTIGEQLRLVIEAEGSNITPETWIVEGDLPEGVTSTTVVNAATAVIDGIPIETGSFPVTVRAWQKINMRGKEATPISFTIVVEPLISQQPSNQSVDWNGAIELMVLVKDPEEVTYQWQKQNADNPELYDDLPGQTGAVLSFPNVNSTDAGLYQVIATKGSAIEVSMNALLTVNATPYQSWLDTHFEDRFSVEAGKEQNNDFDNNINLVESLFGGDPAVADSFPFPAVAQEVINEIQYGVFRYPAVPPGAESQITPEATDDLVENFWTPLQNGVDGVVVESTDAGYVVKVPADSHKFCRLRISQAP